MRLDRVLKLAFCLLLLAYSPLTFWVDKHPAASYPYWEVYSHLWVTLLPGLLLLVRGVRLSDSYQLLVLLLFLLDAFWGFLFYWPTPEPWLFKGL